MSNTRNNIASMFKLAKVNDAATSELRPLLYIESAGLPSSILEQFLYNTNAHAYNAMVKAMELNK